MGKQNKKKRQEKKTHTTNINQNKTNQKMRKIGNAQK